MTLSLILSSASCSKFLSSFSLISVEYRRFVCSHREYPLILYFLCSAYYSLAKFALSFEDLMLSSGYYYASFFLLKIIR